MLHFTIEQRKTIQDRINELEERRTLLEAREDVQGRLTASDLRRVAKLSGALEELQSLLDTDDFEHKYQMESVSGHDLEAEYENSGPEDEDADLELADYLNGHGQGPLE